MEPSVFAGFLLRHHQLPLHLAASLIKGMAPL